MTVTSARQDVAQTLSGVTNFEVRTRPVLSPRAYDGWVVLSSIRPSDFRNCYATFTVLLILGSDETKAEQIFDENGTRLIDAAASLNATDITLESQALVVGNTATPLYALALTMTLEVS
jgi:hypothetical protein